eukprot:7326593-Karenia_brevis.AAC.1
MTATCKNIVDSVAVDSGSTPWPAVEHTLRRMYSGCNVSFFLLDFGQRFRNAYITAITFLEPFMNMHTEYTSTRASTRAKLPPRPLQPRCRSYFNEIGAPFPTIMCPFTMFKLFDNLFIVDVTPEAEMSREVTRHLAPAPSKLGVILPIP